jgi:hypothetical protein
MKSRARTEDNEIALVQGFLYIAVCTAISVPLALLANYFMAHPAKDLLSLALSLRNAVSGLDQSQSLLIIVLIPGLVVWCGLMLLATKLIERIAPTK